MNRPNDHFPPQAAPLDLPRGPIMCGIEGVKLSSDDKRRLSHPLVGGVILFTRNIVSPEQLRKLCDSIHALRNPALLIGVDQEGGRVQRMRGQHFVNFPPMGALQHFIESSPEANQRYAQQIGEQLAKELRRFHIDFSFTPVLDLDYGVSEIIGDRSFGPTPGLVEKLAGALCQGLGRLGVASVGKHFPGHGYVSADSHVAMPEDPRNWVEIQPDLEPYRRLNSELRAVMMAHVVYPTLDPTPAGFSRFWIDEVLRQDLKFDGLVFSDDLGMVGAQRIGDLVARADAAFTAGCDVVLACNEFEALDDLLQRWTPQMDATRQKQLAERWAGMEPKWWQQSGAPGEVRQRGIRRRFGRVSPRTRL